MIQFLFSSDAEISWSTLGMIFNIESHGALMLPMKNPAHAKVNGESKVDLQYTP